MSVSKKSKVEEARKRAEALKAKKKLDRSAKAKPEATAVASKSNKKAPSIVKKSVKKK